MRNLKRECAQTSEADRRDFFEDAEDLFLKKISLSFIPFLTLSVKNLLEIGESKCKNKTQHTVSRPNLCLLPSTGRRYLNQIC